MNAQEIIETYQEEKESGTNRKIRDPEKRKLYPEVKKAVEAGVPLLRVLKILHEKQGAFEGEDLRAQTWHVFANKLADDGVKLKKEKSE